MSTVAAEAVEKHVQVYFGNKPSEVTRVSFGIHSMQGIIGRGYTVTRNALNLLVREGKATRRTRWGAYDYTFERPAPVVDV